MTAPPPTVAVLREALLDEVGARHLIHAVALDGVLAATRASLVGSSLTAWERRRVAPDEAVSAALAEDRETAQPWG
jgi:hypothetical protein